MDKSKNKEKGIEIKSIKIVEIVDDIFTDMIINDDYSDPVPFVLFSKTNKLLYSVAENKLPLKDKNRSAFNYLNSKNSPLVQMGYKPKRILRECDNKIIENIPIEMISKRAFARRTKKKK